MPRNVSIIDAPQRSAAWFAARAGRLTGSVAKDMLATIKTGEAASRRDLRVQLVVERLTGHPQVDGFVNAAMQWGIDHEADAFAALESQCGLLVERSGFLAHDALLVGCSLDGHLDDFRTIVELKCPKSATHYGYWRGDRTLPSDHVAQVTHNLWVTGAERAIFASFDPRFPPERHLWVVEIPRASVDVAAYEAKALAFLAEVDRDVAVFRGWDVMTVSA